MPLRNPDPRAQLRVVIDDLACEFPDLDADEIVAVAREEFESLAARSRAPAFVGILSERRARDRLRVVVHRRQTESGSVVEHGR